MQFAGTFKTEVLRLIHTIRFLLLAFILGQGLQAAAQQVMLPAPSADSIRIITIKQSRTLRQRNIDSVTMLETVAGSVIITEGLTTFYCDSATINRKTNIVEAFGNIHINDNDSIHTYAQYLKYIGGERVAYLKKNVKLTDKKGTLLTDDLEYNLRTGIATYKNGGRILNDKTVLTSREGVYYADTKDVYFKRTCHLKDPKYDITTDSLLYNLKTSVATFITQTHIVSKDATIDTRSGTYNLKTGEAFFFNRTFFKDSTHSGVADNIAYDEKTHTIQMEGNAKLVDSVNRFIVLCNLIFLNKEQNSFLATRKSVMVLYRDNDSTYITADTLFSGLRKYDTLERRTVTITDTLGNKVRSVNTADSSIRYF
ncbi:MAG: OstA family protein, partial [Chitinophagaceae bacterium]|nr:OstA family protein [Chitinophagaceae bacterium]